IGRSRRVERGYSCPQLSRSWNWAANRRPASIPKFLRTGMSALRCLRPIVADALRSLPIGCATLTFCLVGCTILKPSGVNPQSFILTPLPAATAPSNHVAGGVGIGLIKIPGYLFKNSIAVRQGTNQVAYLEKAVWAEHLD